MSVPTNRRPGQVVEADDINLLAESINDLIARNGVTFAPPVPTYSDLPAFPDDGEGVIVTSEESMYVWSAANSAWIGPIPVRGPQGDPGAPGGPMSVTPKDGYVEIDPDAIPGGSTAAYDAAVSPVIANGDSNTNLELRKRYFRRGSIIHEPEFYGASGNGIVNDSVSLQTTMDEAAGETVYLSGRYKIIKTINVSAGTTITGPGSIYVAHNGTGLELIGDDITLDGITVEGTYTGASGLSLQRLVSASPALTDGTQFLRNITIRNVRALNAGLGCVRLRWVDGFVIDNLSAYSWGQSAVAVTNSRRGSVSRSNLRHDGMNPYGATYCINVSTAESDWADGSSTVDPGSRWVDIDGNHVSNCPWTAISCHGAVGVRIRGNTILGNRSGVGCVIVSPEFPGTESVGIIMTDNYVDGLDLSSRVGGLRISGSGAESLTIIANNVVRRHGNPGSVAGGGIDVLGILGAVVSANNVSECAGSGIGLRSASRSIASGNIVTDTWGSEDTVAAAFWIDEGAEGTNTTRYYTLTGNSVRRGILAEGGNIGVINSVALDGPNVASTRTYQSGNDWSGATLAHDAFNVHRYQIGWTNTISTRIGFYGAVPQYQRSVTGSRGGNEALESLLTTLATYGLIDNQTT